METSIFKLLLYLQWQENLCELFGITWFSALVGHKMWCDLHLSVNMQDVKLIKHKQLYFCLYGTYPWNTASASEKSKCPLDLITPLWQQYIQTSVSGSCASDLHIVQEEPCFLRKLLWLSHIRHRMSGVTKSLEVKPQHLKVRASKRQIFFV